MAFLVLWCAQEMRHDNLRISAGLVKPPGLVKPRGVSDCELSTYTFSPICLWVVSHFSMLPNFMIHLESFHALESLCTLCVPLNLSETSAPSITFGFHIKIVGFFFLWFLNFCDAACPALQPCEVHIQTIEFLWGFPTNPDPFLLMVLFQGMVIYQWGDQESDCTLYFSLQPSVKEVLASCLYNVWVEEEGVVVCLFL